ncbi:hypothetical protein KFL_003230100 [Klebsormidium nitens]|uniref:Uncharacterized protein n=1 Tax=Klebsormidium nitens TaxID=105231 RepID=A0A1Y1I7M4_KLENI|nr:hypothetical protein KFL_003230100 [Klebsormidium nitens]|eukprot:GAQ86965.1 hypothetical protein KFL_003230100 [Klebsormidium nitens]
METSSLSSSSDANFATSPYAKHTSLRGAAGYRAWKGAPGPSQSPGGGATEAAESSSAWPNRARSQKNGASHSSSGDGRVRESVSRSGLRSGSKVDGNRKGDGEGFETQPRKAVPAWKTAPQNASGTLWDRLSQASRPASRPPSRQIYSGVKLRKTPETPEEGSPNGRFDTTPNSNRPPSRRRTEGRVDAQRAESVSDSAGEEPETYDMYSRGFSRGPATGGRPAWNQGAAGAASRAAWTTGPQALRASMQRSSRPSSRLSSRQASREGSVAGDVSYQWEDMQPSKESSGTDLVSVSSQDGGESERVASKGGGGARPGSRMSVVDVLSFAEESGREEGNDENREPGSRPPSEGSSFRRTPDGRPSPAPSEQHPNDLQSKKARLSAHKADVSEAASGTRRSWGGVARAQASAPRISESPRVGEVYRRPASARDWSPIRKRKDDPLQPQTLAEYMATPRSPLRSPVCPPRPVSARNADVGMTPLNLDTPTRREAPVRQSLDADEDPDDVATFTDVQQRISAARHNTTDLRPATTANVTRAGLLSAPPPSAVKEVDLSALADKLFQPREHMPRSGSVTSASLQLPADALPPPNGLSLSRRQSARRDAMGATNQGVPLGGDTLGAREQNENEEARKGLRRPPSRQKPPPESLHLFTADSSGPATLGASLELDARPETTAGHMRVGVSQARAVQSEPINRLHKLFIRPPSRQRPPPEALCLGGIEAAAAEKSFREIYSSSDCESP